MLYSFSMEICQTRIQNWPSLELTEPVSHASTLWKLHALFSSSVALGKVIFSSITYSCCPQNTVGVSSCSLDRACSFHSLPSTACIGVFHTLHVAMAPQPLPNKSGTAGHCQALQQSSFLQTWKPLLVLFRVGHEWMANSKDLQQKQLQPLNSDHAHDFSAHA